MLPWSAQVGPLTERANYQGKRHGGRREYEEPAILGHGLHFEFCILHFRHGLAGSISTAMFRHLP